MWKSLVSGLWVVGLGWGAAQAAPPQPVVSKAVAKARQTTVVAEPQETVALSEEQLVLAQRVVLGKVPCELGAHVSVWAHPSAPGRFVLEHGIQTFHMTPIPTSTGAIRLEDTVGGAVWLQLANKSMLMDQKQGRRLADACMNADQVVVADRMTRSPVPHLLEPLPMPSSATTATPVDSSSGVLQTATN